MEQILNIKAREILDSRGFPTLEVDMQLSNGSFGRASVPSGKSTGTKEAVESRDIHVKRFGGKGVTSAVGNVEQVLFPALKGKAFATQEDLDQSLIELDGTPDKRHLGANAILGCSLAFARATANAKKVPLVRHLASLYEATDLTLPVPMMNVINGGKHADSGIATQEFMLVPHGAHSAAEAVWMGAETYQALRELLKTKGYRVSVGDEGGFAPHLNSTEEALEILTSAIEKAGYVAGEQISLGIDFAANDFYRNGMYWFEGQRWTAEKMTDYCIGLAKKFPVVSIEDGLAEDDWDGWIYHTTRLNDAGLQCVGDDIFVTNARIFQDGIDKGVANAILIKLNQIGTLTETFETMRLAKKSGYRTVVSHRSGETDDAFIADFAVATGAGQMKAGAPARGERAAKYNQLIRLEEELQSVLLARELYARH